MSYILFFSLCLCSTMQICKIFFAFSNMIQGVFVPLYFNSWYPCFFSSNHIYILVSLHTFWTYCTAIYGLMLFLNATMFFIVSIFIYWCLCIHSWTCSKAWLGWNQDKLSEWSDMSAHRLLFQWTSTIKIQLVVLV